MNNYQLGKLGLSLLAVYAFLAGVLALGESLGAGANTLLGLQEPLCGNSTASKDFFGGIFGRVVVLYFSSLILVFVTPAALLWLREPLARRWFNLTDSPLTISLSSPTLLRLALVILGAATALNGFLGAGGTLMGWLVASGLEWPSDPEEPISRTMHAQLQLSALGGVARAAIEIALGLLLIRVSRTLAERWA